MTTLKMVCEHCGGENVKRDAWAEWDVASQQWTLGAVFDNSYCDGCGGETSIEEVEIDGPQPSSTRYLDRFPAEHRVSAERAYQDGFKDGCDHVE